jgi:hypothetical protein
MQSETHLLIGKHFCLYSQQFDHLIDMLCCNINLSAHVQLDSISLQWPQAAFTLSDSVQLAWFQLRAELFRLMEATTFYPCLLPLMLCSLLPNVPS